MKIPMWLLLLFSLWHAPLSFASDISIDVRSAGGGTRPGNGGYLELGVGVNVIYFPEDFPGEPNILYDYYAFIGGAYRYNGIFFEGADGTLDGFNIGYQLWNNAIWSIDILASSFSGVINEEGESLASMEIFDDLYHYHDADDDGVYEYYHHHNEDGRPEQPLQDGSEFQILSINQNTFYNGAGLRATAYMDDYVFQYRLVTDVHGGNGVTSTARIGRHWQVRNWNFHGIVGLAYSSEKTNEYLWGSRLESSTGETESFSPGNTVNLEAEVGVVYPLSQNWIFRSFVRYIEIPDQPDDSPIIVDDYEALFATTISYVF